MDKDVKNRIVCDTMNKIDKILKARKKMKSLMLKQDKVFYKLLDDLGENDPHDCILADWIFDYLYNGTPHALKYIKKNLQRNAKTVAWWQR